MAVSIKDVARAAGVSPATVSRSLGRGPVSDEVRRKVEAAVEATGYRPNLAARRLRSQNSMTLGLIVADIRNAFFTDLVRAVETVAYQQGMRVLLCNTDEDPKREAMYLDLMAEERVSGLILAPTTSLSPARLAQFTLPLVLVDRTIPGAACDRVILNNVAASGQLVDLLVATGRRRVAGLFGMTSATGRERLEGYELAMKRHGIDPMSYTAPPTPEAARAVLADILAKRPEAVVLSNGRFIGAMLRLCHDLGLNIPQDIAIAGFDDEPWTAFVQPGITVIRQPVESFGSEATRMLLARQRDPMTPHRTVILDGAMVVRGSTAPKAG